jgi:hypothetical protein
VSSESGEHDETDDAKGAEVDYDLNDGLHGWWNPRNCGKTTPLRGGEERGLAAHAGTSITPRPL